MKQDVRLVFRHVDPDEVSRRLGCQPSHSRRPGGRNPGGAIHRYYYWELSSGLDPRILDSDLHFAALFANLDAHWQALRAFAAEHEADIAWSIYVESDGETPISGLSIETVRRVASIPASIGIDIYTDQGIDTYTEPP